MKVLRGHDDGITSIAFSPIGEYYITGSLDKTAKIWRFESENCLQTLKGHFSEVSAVDISADGKYCLTGSWDETAMVWNFKDGTGSFDNTTKIWDAESGMCLKTIEPQHLLSVESETEVGWLWHFPYLAYQEEWLFHMHRLVLHNNSHQLFFKFINTLYIAMHLHLENCDFRGVETSDTLLKMLYQYGAIT